jgi:ribosomal protein S18 acetylase RimI-like enzyme
MMRIRHAGKKDAVDAAYLIHYAIKDIAEALTGETEPEKIRDVLICYFEQDVNRLSYQNCLVMEEKETVIGLVIAYHGDQDEALDEPIVERLRRIKRDSSLTVDKEADPGDFYIDTLCVNPEHQGKRIGTKLIQAAEQEAYRKGYDRISLNAEQYNEGAIKLYSRLGFVTEKVIDINGHDYNYMVKQL